MICIDDVYVGKTSGSTAGHEFTWNCIDDGKYLLVETATPEGFAALPGGVTFEIDAEHEEVADDPHMTSFTAKSVLLDGGDCGEHIAKTVDAAGTVTLNVLNEPVQEIIGVELPSAGGPGTNLIFFTGSVMTMLAGAGFVMKRRRSEAEKR